jgi:mannose-6-phosphate isomerase-like protein (cupin superfamily)
MISQTFFRSTFHRWVTSAPVILTIGACAPDQPEPRLIDLTGATPVSWTAQDRARPIVVRTIRQSQHASFQWILINAAEDPHVHDRTDMTVVIVTGKVRMHLGDSHQMAGPGDVIDVPMGTSHWVQNLHSEGSTAFSVFSPAYDGKDRRSIK